MRLIISLKHVNTYIIVKPFQLQGWSIGFKFVTFKENKAVRFYYCQDPRPVLLLEKLVDEASERKRSSRKEFIRNTIGKK